MTFSDKFNEPTAKAGTPLANELGVAHEQQLKRGSCLVVLHGTIEEVVRAKDLLADKTLEHVDVHAA